MTGPAPDGPTTAVPPLGGPASPGGAAPAAPGGRGDLTDELLATRAWTEDLLARAGIPIVDVPIVSVGAGLGSFALVDTLRIAGVPAASIRVIGHNDHACDTYAYLCRNSQIPDHERLRSDAASVMDNIWGFPSYALREAWSERTLKPIWTVATEPVLSEYFTPRLGQVYRSVLREEARIGWAHMLVRGQVRMVRPRVGGGYFTINTPPAGSTGTPRVAYRSSIVHLAMGYPGLRFLPDLQAYRETHRDASRVVNAYEPHDHLYDQLRAKPGTVLVRGAGIVASRVLQRLIEDRDRHGAQTQIVHLFRSFAHGTSGPATFRRQARHGVAIQAFNYPKGAWGGQLRESMLSLEGDARADLIKAMGGTNTPFRADWQEQLDRGLREGFYKQFVGSVTEVVPGPDGSIVTKVDTGQGRLELAADAIIDGTGLEADITSNRALADLLEHGARRNPMGRLDVEPTFEVRGMRAEPGRLYASGAMTLGGYYAPVDSFLGLQYAAQTIADDLAAAGFAPRLGTARSIKGWWAWARNRPVG